MSKQDEKIAGIIALTVTLVWALSMLVDAFSTAYQPPVLIHASLLTTVGIIMGFRTGRSGGR
jgi:hypothetical protein